MFIGRYYVKHGKILLCHIKKMERKQNKNDCITNQTIN